MRIMGFYIAKFIARFIYFFLKFLPTFNKVVLISRFNSTTSIDFKYLEKEIKINHTTKVVILNHKLKNKFFLIFDVLQEMYHLATSKGAIVDSYIIPVSILNHKRNLIIIQIWHALGSIKKFGHACLDTKEGSSSKLSKIMQMHQNYTYIIASGPKTIKPYDCSFNSLKTRILPYGMPRIDYLIDKSVKELKRNELFTKYPGLKDKKNILYFPTFRKGTEIPYEKVISSINLDKYNLIVLKHQNDKTKIPNNPNIYVLNKYPVMDIMFITNYFISDYSASFFEAALLNIPFHAYVFDYEKYQITRGLFMNLKEEIPGIISNDITKIIEGINTNTIDLEKYKNFKKNYVSASDGLATKKVVSLLNLGGK